MIVENVGKYERGEKKIFALLSQRKFVLIFHRFFSHALSDAVNHSKTSRNVRIKLFFMVTRDFSRVFLLFPHIYHKTSPSTPKALCIVSDHVHESCNVLELFVAVNFLLSLRMINFPAPTFFACLKPLQQLRLSEKFKIPSRWKRHENLNSGKL
jgi:hypothetical protein